IPAGARDKRGEDGMQPDFRNLALLGTVSLLATAMHTSLATAADTTGYKLKTLYSFCEQSGCPDGDAPSAGVLKDPNGTLYGIAAFGGKFGDGTFFSLTPKTGATYKFHTTYS